MTLLWTLIQKQFSGYINKITIDRRGKAKIFVIQKENYWNNGYTVFLYMFYKCKVDLFKLYLERHGKF